jgi:hypothetical protein
MTEAEIRDRRGDGVHWEGDRLSEESMIIDSAAQSVALPCPSADAVRVAVPKPVPA